MADRAQQGNGKPSRRGQAAGRRSATSDAQRGREHASTTGRRRPRSSGPTKGKSSRAATQTRPADGTRATRVRESGRPRTRPKAGTAPNGTAPPRRERRQKAAPSHQDEGPLAELWQSLKEWLERLQRKLKRVLDGPEARKILSALLSRRLPGPLSVLVQGLLDPDQRGFVFWWMVVTVVATLAIALLLSIALVPVTGLVALAGVGIWMLTRQDRQPAAEKA